MIKSQDELDEWCDRQGYKCYVNYRCNPTAVFEEYPILTRFIAVGFGKGYSVVYQLVNDYCGKDILNYQDEFTSKMLNKVLNEVRLKDGYLISSTDHSDSKHIPQPPLYKERVPINRHIAVSRRVLGDVLSEYGVEGNDRFCAISDFISLYVDEIKEVSDDL